MAYSSSSNVTSHPVWANMTSALLNRTDAPWSNASYAYDVTTMTSLSVTQCVWNDTLNQTLCEAVLPGDAGDGDNVTDGGGEVSGKHSLALTIFLGILVSVISIVTVLGNITVLLAFGLERSIRQPTNYFIASLAVSDLLIGTFSMPLFTQYLLLNYWPLGPWLCDLWLSLDWTVCLTSQYTVFLITMDRFLSVKIPAKYRNWRTERKVLIMVGVTWVFPAVIFFTTIIGWQFFVGERTVLPGACEVQFLSTPLFTFLLTIGYYWITLIVMCGLYAGIYKVALDLQRKSDAKQRKLESTMELAGDHSAAKGTASNSSDSQQQGANSFKKLRQKKKQSVKTNDAIGGGGGKVGDQNNVSKGQRKVNTTSFGGQNKLGPGDVGHRDSLGGASMATDMGDNKEEDRSSSPAFASDEENSSSGAHPGDKSPKASTTPNNARAGKAALNPKVGIAGIVNTALLTTPDSLRQTQNMVKPAHLSDPSHTETSGTPMPPSGQFLRPSHGGPHYSRLDQGHDSSAEHEGGGKLEVDSLYSSSASDKLERSTAPLLETDITKGCIYIDEKSFLNLTTGDHSQPLLAITDGKSEGRGGNELDSPLWKRRNSLPLPPLASDIFDIVIDDEFTDIGITEFTTTTTGLTSKLNGEEARINEGGANGSQPTEAVPGIPTIQHPAGERADDNQGLTEPRRARKGDGRLHSFVKSVRSRNSRRRNRRERKSKSENRARKALRTITIILGAFVLCWTPYHIMVFVIALCGGASCVNLEFYFFTYWLCYLNSPINPFCYAFANAQFKRTFLRILRFDWHRT